LTCASDARFGHAGLGAPWAFDHEVEITRAIGRLRHGLAGLADMNRASLHILITDAVAALSRARIMAAGVQRAQPVEPWHKLMFARVVDKHVLIVLIVLLLEQLTILVEGATKADQRRRGLSSTNKKPAAAVVLISRSS
jgi:hypothetical protein